MGERPWRIDAGVARDLAEALGWSGDDGVAALAARFPERVPMGSTAKLAAIAAGEVPPGAEVEDLARRILAHQAAWAAGVEGGAPSPSWSCWVAATLMAALADAAGLGPVDVAATRRTDDRSPVVDLHAAVVVAGDDGTEWICDPYFGLALALPAGPGATAEVDRGLSRASAARPAGPGGRWTLEVALAHWERGGLAYRVLAPSMDVGDVRAAAAISVVHSGVPSRPYARLHVAGGVLDAFEADDGGGTLSHWVAAGAVAGPGGTQRHVTWDEANAGFAARTGVRII